MCWCCRCVDSGVTFAAVLLGRSLLLAHAGVCDSCSSNSCTELSLKHALQMGASFFKLPGGRLRPGEDGEQPLWVPEGRLRLTGRMLTAACTQLLLTMLPRRLPAVVVGKLSPPPLNTLQRRRA